MRIGGWQWLDWSVVPGALDWLGFLLGGLGIGFTIVQLLKSRSALETARKTLETARTQLTKNQLSGMLPGVYEIQRSLELALKRDDPDATADALNQFGLYAAESVALLGALDEYESVANDLEVAAVEASSARSNIYTRLASDTMRDVAGDASLVIAQLSQSIKSLSVRIMNDPGSVNG